MNIIVFSTKKDGKWDYSSRWVLAGDKDVMIHDFKGWEANMHAILNIMTRTDI